jgi:hypothetical protein
MTARTATLLVTAALPIVALGGCGGGGKKTVTPAGGGQPATTVREAEYSLTPGTINVTKAGTVMLTAQNGGKMTHALEIEGNGVEKRTANIQPGSSAQLTVDLKPGS